MEDFSMNFVLSIIMILVSFVGVLLAYRFFGKAGLFVWISFAIVVANIQVLKNVHLLGVVITLGNVVYGSIYLCTDILSEKYGKKDATKAVWMGFFSMIFATLLMQIALFFTPDSSDFAHGAMETLFSVMPRVMVASLAAYLISQNIDVFLYHKIKEKFPGDRYLFIRNNGSTLISQFIDSIIFAVGAFYGFYDTPILIDIVITTYLMKGIVALLDTPFIYIAKRIKPPSEITSIGD